MPRKQHALIFLLLLGSAPVWAAQQIPEDAQRELSSQTNVIANQEKKVREKLSEKPEIEIQKENEAPNNERGPVFFVKKIVLEGNTVVSTQELRRFIAAFENREASFKQLRALSEVITNVYRSRGYVTSRAYLPPQTVEDGVVTIKVVEGKVGKVIVDGNKFFNARSYQRRMKFDSNIFRYQDLESSLYYVNQLPDRQAKAFLIPGEELASSDIILKVKDKNPLHMYYDFNNRGTKLTNRARDGFHIDNNNLTGNDDVFNSSFTTAAEGAFNGGSVNYSVPVGDSPVSVSVAAGYVKTRLIGFLKSAKITGESFSFEPGLTYTLVQKPEKEISLYAGLEYVNSLSAIDNTTTSDDRMRSLDLGPRIILQDINGRSFINADMHVGLPGFLGGLEANDPQASIATSGGEFTFYTVNFVRIQRLPASMFAILKTGGQWSPDTLTSVEQYRAGGAYSVRGYPEADAAGDYGWNASAELNSPLGFLPKEWLVPFTKKSWLNAFHIVGFLDTAKTYLRDKTIETAVKDKFLMGVGYGFRLDLDDYLSAQLDIGYPIGDDSTDKNNSQVHFAMRAGF